MDRCSAGSANPVSHYSTGDKDEVESPSVGTVLTEEPNPVWARYGIATAPHAMAAQSALAILREGGNAVEAMIAAAATVAVTYPHMNGVGGDGFWLIARPGMDPVGIEACGTAARRATIESYRARGLAGEPRV